MIMNIYPAAAAGAATFNIFTRSIQHLTLEENSTLKENSTRGLKKEHSWNTLILLKEHLENIKANSSNTRFTLKAQSKHTQRTLVSHPESTMGTFKAHSVNIKHTQFIFTLST